MLESMCRSVSGDEARGNEKKRLYPHSIDLVELFAIFCNICPLTSI